MDLLPDSLAGIACSTDECQSNVVGDLSPKHRDGRLQFFTEQCLSMKQEFKCTQFALVA
jgi:hypothetical protein